MDSGFDVFELIRMDVCVRARPPIPKHVSMISIRPLDRVSKSHASKTLSKLEKIKSENQIHFIFVDSIIIRPYRGSNNGQQLLLLHVKKMCHTHSHIHKHSRRHLRVRVDSQLERNQTKIHLEATRMNELLC